MTPDLNDTIVALSSAPGPGGRAIVRLSGPDALPVALSTFGAEAPVSATRRSVHTGRVTLPDINAPLPTDLYFWPGPRSYTGQNLVELHTLSSPPLVDLLIARLLSAGARAAAAGEFTMRAFLSGKLDLTRAEAVLGVLEARDRDDLTRALAQFAGGVAQPLAELRSDLLDLLADVEAGLDFGEEDIQFVSTEQLLTRIGKGLALLTNLNRRFEQRAVSGRPFRAALVGRPNAGKSSLFNALSGASALVSHEPGTTRDYLARRLELGAVSVELIDTAGWQPASGTIEEQAQSLGRGAAGEADLLLVCLECGRTPDAEEAALLAHRGPEAVAVATKSDLGNLSSEHTPVSAVTGQGLDSLRAMLARRAEARSRPALAPSLSRCRHHVEAALGHLRRAHSLALFQEPVELLALELRGALDQVGEMSGAVYTDELLDRIFSRFCIGK
jgi:tRNA modification GTPase